MNIKNISIDISIIIVNYNVKGYLTNLLYSILEAEKGLNLEIIVVDNASSDGSIEYLKQKFPYVHFIENKENIGFAKANNQGIKIAKGKFTLLVNPDVLISEETLMTMVRHMENNPRTGVAGCKILNPDGSFAPESRRSVPTPIMALWKIFGLTNLFVKSKIFGRYYLGWSDPNEASSVPVLSGAFMFFRNDLLVNLNGFDEQFFMYGEDIDLCCRVSQAGFALDYVPFTNIIHFKGRSTNKRSINYIMRFNKAMYLFYIKHSSNTIYSYPIRFFIFFGILLHGIIFSIIAFIFPKRTSSHRLVNPK